MRFKILLKEKVDQALLREIQSKYGEDIEGINELYELLIRDGTCDSYTPSKIYYVAYTLSLSDIEMIIIQMN